MRVAFFHKGYEDLGVEALSAWLKAHGHHVDLYWDGGAFSSNIGLDNPLLARLLDASPGRFASRVRRRISERPPDLVGFTGATVNHKWSLGWARWIKENLGVPVVFGGPHATTAPEAVLREGCVDAVVRGEGEGALLELMETLDHGKFTDRSIRNVWFYGPTEPVRNPVRPYIRDLDGLPFPDKDIFNDKADVFYKHYMIVAGRGCPFACSYCCQPAYKALYAEERTHARRRSPENVVAEIVRARLRHEIRLVSFRDDVFTMDVDWLERFAAIYRERVGLPFFCYVHPDTVTPRVADALAAAGCLQVKMGVQTFDERTRREWLARRHDNRRIFEAGRLIRDRGIELLVDHILLLPGETEADVADAVDKYIDLQPDSITCFHLVLFPGTPMADAAVERGLIGLEDRAAIDRGEQPAEFSNPGRAIRRANARKLKYQYYMDLVPILPRRAMRLLLRSRLLHALPYSFGLRQAILLAGDILRRSVRPRYLVWYALARKRFP